MCLTLANDLTFTKYENRSEENFDKTNTSKDVTNKFENLNIKQKESVFVVDQNPSLRRKVILKIKNGKLHDV